MKLFVSILIRIIPSIYWISRSWWVDFGRRWSAKNVVGGFSSAQWNLVSRILYSCGRQSVLGNTRVWRLEIVVADLLMASDNSKTWVAKRGVRSRFSRPKIWTGDDRPANNNWRNKHSCRWISPMCSKHGRHWRFWKGYIAVFVGIDRFSGYNYYKIYSTGAPW